MWSQQCWEAASCSNKCVQDIVGVDVEVVGGGGAAAHDELRHCCLGSSVHILSLHMHKQSFYQASISRCKDVIMSNLFAVIGSHVGIAGYGFIVHAVANGLSNCNTLAL